MFDIIKKSVLFISILTFIADCNAIRCYQCSSNTDPAGVDLCGAYNTFDTERNIASDCYSEDSKVPGTFCVKIVQQSPIGFIWDGRWRQVIRRCASVASTGVTGVCNWGVYENGVYWEECYCSEDSCNKSPNLYSSTTTYICLLTTIFAFIINKR